MVNVLFVMVTILLAVKFILLESVRRIFDVPFALVLFAMALALAVVAPETDQVYRLSGVLSKAMIVFIALKFLVTTDRKHALFAAAGLCGASLVMLL